MKPCSYANVRLTGRYLFDRQERNRTVTLDAVYDRFSKTGRVAAFDFTCRSTAPQSTGSRIFHNDSWRQNRMSRQVLAFDFGASSGRAMLVSYDGGVTLTELHRFANEPVTVDGCLCWDIDMLLREVKTGLRKAAKAGGFDAVGIDTWGVDYGIIGPDGKLLTQPAHYRDTRTADMPERVFAAVPRDDIYRATGIQFLHFNTLYQLYYLKENKPYLLADGNKMLLMPDLLAYFLTGAVRAEETVASTTNLYDPSARDWHWELIEKLGFPRGLFPPIIRAGQTYGTLSPAVCAETGCEPVPLIAVGTHDTASAVVSVPARTDNFAYISCGTWSLFGTESPAPVKSDAARRLNFTNETGVFGTVRLLKNIMGLWIIQESRRAWKRQGEDVSFDTLEREALAADPARAYIDCDAPDFEAPGDLPARIRDFCRKTGQPVPDTRGEVMRCIYESLALKYRHTLGLLSDITGVRYDALHMVGGGIKDTLLCQMTADACNIPVFAGPAEATATGNAAMQLISLGDLPDLSAARKIIADSVALKTYLPKPGAVKVWEQAYRNYKKALSF